MVVMFAVAPALGADVPLDTAGCEILSTWSEVRFTFHIEIGGPSEVALRPQPEGVVDELGV
ncbi:MAG: hypothetical protein AAF211_31715, partial [Myxococcota bacterium]